jgi:Outer membrane efflux protein
MGEAFSYPGGATDPRSACGKCDLPEARRIRRGLGPLLFLSLLALMIGFLGSSRPTLAMESEPAITLSKGPLDFDACARLAIRQSPYFTKTSVEIDIRKMDESDARYTVFPPAVTFRSYYYIDSPSQFGVKARPYSLNFVTESYNPFGSYFTLQADKMATQMTVFAHLKLISEGLERIGKIFLNLAAMKRLAAAQGDLISLCRENLTYAKNRQSIGTGTSLEVKVATQELAVAQSEKERLETSRKRLLTSLKTFLGLKADQPIDLDLGDARRQVLGNFDPAAATLEQAKANSFDLKALELKKKMQGYNIALAKARIFPSLLFNATTPDPLSAVSGHGIFVGFGLEVPVWDGFKRIRNVSRQKAILRQFGAEKDVKEDDLTDKWNSLQGDRSMAAAALKAAQSQEELARLKERQGEIQYNSGTEPLSDWLAARKATLEAQKTTTNKTLEDDELILNLRQFSGDLGNSYVDAKSWQN